MVCSFFCSRDGDHRDLLVLTHPFPTRRSCAQRVEMVSADPKDIAGVRGRLAYGSRDGVDASAGLGTTLGSGLLSLFGSYGRGDGFIPTVEGQRGAVDRPSPYEIGRAQV